jgi:hypothetical protein
MLPKVLLALLVLLTACNAAPGPAWETEDQIEAIDGQTWVVGSHLVTVPADASITGNPTVGATVRVSGQRSNRGELVIDSVEVTQAIPAVRKASPTPAPQHVVPVQQRPAAPQPAPAREKKGGHGGD